MDLSGDQGSLQDRMGDFMRNRIALPVRMVEGVDADDRRALTDVSKFRMMQRDRVQPIAELNLGKLGDSVAESPALHHQK